MSSEYIFQELSEIVKKCYLAITVDDILAVQDRFQKEMDNVSDNKTPISTASTTNGNYAILCSLDAQRLYDNLQETVAKRIENERMETIKTMNEILKEYSGIEECFNENPHIFELINEKLNVRDFLRAIDIDNLLKKIAEELQEDDDDQNEGDEKKNIDNDDNKDQNKEEGDESTRPLVLDFFYSLIEGFFFPK